MFYVHNTIRLHTFLTYDMQVINTLASQLNYITHARPLAHVYLCASFESVCFQSRSIINAIVSTRKGFISYDNNMFCQSIVHFRLFVVSHTQILISNYTAEMLTMSRVSVATKRKHMTAFRSSMVQPNKKLSAYSVEPLDYTSEWHSSHVDKIRVGYYSY